MDTHGMRVDQLQSKPPPHKGAAECAEGPPHILRQLEGTPQLQRERGHDGENDNDPPAVTADLSVLDEILHAACWVELGAEPSGSGSGSSNVRKGLELDWEGAAASVCDAARPWSAAEGSPLIQILRLTRRAS